MDNTHFKLIIDSVLWAIKHETRGIYKTGLDILKELFTNINRDVPANRDQFYKFYFSPILKDMLAIMTDRMHKSGIILYYTNNSICCTS